MGVASDTIGQVRLLMADVGATEYLSDFQVGDFLALNGDNPYLAAADALESIAVSEVLVGKVIKTQDLSTDGAKVAEALMKLAALRRKRGEEIAAADAGDDFAFSIAYFPDGDYRPEHTNRVQ